MEESHEYLSSKGYTFPAISNFRCKKYKQGCDKEEVGIFTTYHHPHLHHHQDIYTQETPPSYYSIKVDIGLEESEPLMNSYSPKKKGGATKCVKTAHLFN